jgi:filamentous hemagglutinin family protein
MPTAMMSRDREKIMKHNSLALSIALAIASTAASANPQGAQVVQGTATFSNPSANVLNVNNSRNAIINWQQFNIGNGQTTNFIQPSSSSSVLNRVIGNDPSQILGNLNSNGRVFLINQNGILVGEGANVNTAGFFGSTLNITDQDFLNGKLKFNGGGNGDLENYGYIHAGDDGSVVLIAPNIENGGVIEVENGNIILAAGESITITSLQNSSLQFEVQSAENSVTNLGQVIAKNGAAGLFAGTLRHSGSIRAGGLVRDADGTIRLVAAGSAQVSGSVQAGGGNIEILGDTIEIQQGANVDASSSRGGGEILIGGDQQGLNPDVRNATSTTIEQGAEVHADGIASADGGKVIVFAQNDVHVQGEITAKGGAQGGDGGFVETSGKRVLDISAVPDASAANGANGEWLIDPNNITLVSGTGSNITGNPDFTSTDDSALLAVGLVETALNAGTSVTITTGDADADGSSGGVGLQPGDINIQASIAKISGGDASLTFNAHNDINIGDGTGVTIGITSTSGVMDVIFNSDTDTDGIGDIVFDTGTGNSAPITINTNGGVLTTNNDVHIKGDVSNTFSVVNIINTQWGIGQNTALIVSEDLKLDLTGTTVKNNGRIEVDSTAANLDLSGDSLDIAMGGSLVGSGTVIGDVLVNGGSISGGSGYGTFGSLTINGDLFINSGLLYSVVDGFSTSWESNTITANNIAINGGDLMVVWGSSNGAQLASNDSFFAANPVGLASCVGSGCMTGTGFNNIINPMLISNSSVVLSAGNGDTLSYGITYATDIVNNASIDVWQGPQLGSWNVAANWADNTVPTASDYVFIENVDGLTQVDVTGAQVAAGLQAFSLLRVGNGSLTLGGNSFFTRDGWAGSGSVLISDANALVAGNGVNYSGPGTFMMLDQGTLAQDTVSWGNIKMLNAANSFQLDKDLANNGIFLVDDTQAVNTLSGTGSVTNNGLWQVLANLSSSVTVNNTASGTFLLDATGMNVLLDGDSSLDGSLTAVAGSSIFLTGGTHNFVASLVQDGDLNFSGGTYQGVFNQPAASALDIKANDSNIIFDGFTINSQGAVTVSNSANSIAMNNASAWLVQGAYSQLAGSSVQVNNTAAITFDAGSDLAASTGGLLSVNGGLLGVTASVAGPLAFDTAAIALEVIGGGNATFEQNVNLGSLILDGVLTSNANLNVTNMTWNGGSLGGSGAASFGQAEFTGLAAMMLDTQTLNLTGTTDWTSTSNDLTLSNNAQIINTGTFNDTSTAIIAGSGTEVFINNNSYVASSTAAGAIGARFQNNGTVNVQNGASLALLGGGVSSSGSFNVDGTLQLGGSHSLQDVVFSGAGLFEQVAGSTQMNTTGSAVFGLDTTISGGGNLTLNFDSTIVAVQLLGGSLTNTANLAVTNFQWQDGTVDGSGTLAVSNQINFAGGGNQTLDTQTLQLQNQANWSGNGTITLLNSAQINNSGVFTNTGNGTLGGTGSFNNTGSYILNSGGNSTIDAGVAFNNSGTIDLQAGGLDLSGNTLTLGGGTLMGSGSLIGNVVADSGSTIAPGASIGTLNIGGTLNFAAGSSYDLEMDVGSADRIITQGAVTIDPAAQLNIIGFNGYNGVLNDSGSALSSTTSISGAFTLNQHADYTVSEQYISGPPDSLDIAVTGLTNNWIATDGAWEAAANWSRGEAPSLGHDVFLTNAGLVTFASTGAVTINSLSAGETTVLSFSNGVDLRIDGDSLIPGTLNLDASIVRVNGDLSGGDFTLANTSVLDGTGVLNLATLNLQNSRVSGWTTVDAPVLTVSGTSQFNNINLIHNGNIEITGVTDRLILENSAQITSGSTAAFSGAGTLELQATSSNWVVNSPLSMPTAMTLDLNGGRVVNVENVGFPGTVNVSQPNFVENASMVIPATTTFNYLASSDLQPNFDMINNGQFVLQSSAATLNLTTSNFINNAGASFAIDSPTRLNIDSGFVNNGSIMLAVAASRLVAQAGATLTNAGTIVGNGLLIANGGTLDFTAATVLPDTLTLNLASSGFINNAQNLTVNGEFDWFSGSINGSTGGVFTTDGLVNLLSGNLNTDWLIGTNSVVDWTGATAGDLVINNATITNQGEFRMAGLTGTILSSPSTANKDFAASTNASFINQGLLLIDAGTDTVVFDLNFVNDGGRIGILSGAFQIGTNKEDLELDQAGEVLFGFGTFEGDVINQAGVVSPGRFIDETTGVTGMLTINGDYTQGAAGDLVLKMDSTLDGLQHDVLNVTGQLTADGAIDFKLINGVTVLQVAALIDQSFQPLQFNSFAGKFASSTIPQGLNFTLGEGGVISISSDNNLLNEVNNQLEVLFSKDDLDYSKVVKAMKFIDEKVTLLARNDEEDKDEKKRAPRLVCK